MARGALFWARLFCLWDGPGLAARRRRAGEDWRMVLSGALAAHQLTLPQAQAGPQAEWQTWRAATTPDSAWRPWPDSARRIRIAPCKSRQNAVAQTWPSESRRTRKAHIQSALSCLLNGLGCAKYVGFQTDTGKITPFLGPAAEPLDSVSVHCVAHLCTTDVLSPTPADAGQSGGTTGTGGATQTGGTGRNGRRHQLGRVFRPGRFWRTGWGRRQWRREQHGRQGWRCGRQWRHQQHGRTRRVRRQTAGDDGIALQFAGRLRTVHWHVPHVSRSGRVHGLRHMPNGAW
jgi:hypothetical protein